EGEARHHAEVAAPAPDGPEEVGMFGAAGPPDLSIGGDDLHLLQVVHSPTEATCQVPQASPQGKTGDPGLRNEAEDRREPILLCGPIDVSEAAPGSDVRAPRIGL